jgi:hypothetical protein
MRDNDPGDVVDGLVEILPAHQLALLFHQPQLQHLGLDPDVIGIGLTARRLPPLAPQISQIGNAALIEREAAALLLDHAFAFSRRFVVHAAPDCPSVKSRQQEIRYNRISR